jgi:hypothetical protein
MSDKIEARLGQKIEQPTPGTLDLSKVGLLISMPPKDQVEGQYAPMTICPYCGNTGWTSGPSSDYVVCGRCGMLFRASNAG